MSLLLLYHNNLDVAVSITLTCPTFAGTIRVGIPITPVAATASGGVPAYTFSAVGLPAGLSMAMDGTVSGHPNVSGLFSYTTNVIDSIGTTATATCAINIQPSLLTTTCLVLSPIVGTALTPTAMIATGGIGPYTFTAIGLAPGLLLSSNGTMSGTPTTAGIFPYTVRLTDSIGIVFTVNCSVTVAPQVFALIITACPVLTPTVGIAITPFTMQATGGVQPYRFSSLGLPPGLSITAAGVLSGTPTQAGTFQYTIGVTDSVGSLATITCGMAINPAQVIPPPPPPPIGNQNLCRSRVVPTLVFRTVVKPSVCQD